MKLTTQKTTTLTAVPGSTTGTLQAFSRSLGLLLLLAGCGEKAPSPGARVSAIGVQSENGEPEDPEVTGLKERIGALQSKIFERQPHLERERRRQQELVGRLQSGASRGCRAFTKMQAIKLTVKGGNAGELQHSSNVDQLRQAAQETSGSTINFTLGPGITISANLENDQLFSSADGTKISTDFSNYTIGDLTMVQVDKGVAGYITKVSKQGLFRVRQYDEFVETHRYAFDGLTITVVDDKQQEHVVYRADGIGHQLSYPNGGWLAADGHDLRRNKAYVDLMSERECL